MKYFLLGAFAQRSCCSGRVAYGATARRASPRSRTHWRVRPATSRSRSLACVLSGDRVRVQGFVGAVPHVDARRVPGGTDSGDGVHVRGDEDRGVRGARPHPRRRVRGPRWDRTPVMVALSVLSMVLGSVLAIAQTDVKRMLAYSSIAQAGFILAAYAHRTRRDRRGDLLPGDLRAAVVGAFGVVMLVSAGVERTPGSIGSGAWRAVNRRSPGCSRSSCSRSPGSLRLLGSPPRCWSSAPRPPRHGARGLIGALAAVAGAFFYLRLVAIMSMREPEGDASPTLRRCRGSCSRSRLCGRGARDHPGPDPADPSRGPRAAMVTR